MSTQDAKFESFWNTLNQCPYDLPEEIKPYLQNAIKACGFYDTVATSNVNTETSTKTKKLSGYNLFMREKMAELKTQEVPSGERMTQVSQMWKGVSDSDKAIWKDKAASLSGPVAQKTSSSSGAPTTKKLSGYQLYLRETMPEVKIKTEIAPKERMGEIAKMWKALTEEQRGQWKTKATAQ